MPRLSSENTRILVCCHKVCELPEDDSGILLPIHCGAAQSDIDLGIQRDDRVNGEICDNISAKNSNFCELTAMYWAWKNMKKVCPGIEYIGLNHYRRYFTFDERDPWTTQIVKPLSTVKNYRLNVNKLAEALSKNDSIIVEHLRFPYSVEVQYCICCESEDMRTYRKIMHDMYPDYEKDFNRILGGNKLSGFNMFVMKWDGFVHYCEWLFPLLFEAERRIDISAYNTYQARIFGFLSERTQESYLLHNSMRLKYTNMLFYDDNMPSYSAFHNWSECVRFSLVYALTNMASIKCLTDPICRFIRHRYVNLRQIAGKLLRVLGLKQ